MRSTHRLVATGLSLHALEVVGAVRSRHRARSKGHAVPGSPAVVNTLSKIKSGISSDKSALVEPNPQTAARTQAKSPLSAS
jgi:hypothetical protein